MIKNNRLFIISLHGRDIKYTTCMILASMLVANFEYNTDQTIRTEYITEDECNLTGEQVYTVQYYHKDQDIYKQVYFSDFDRAADCFKRTSEYAHCSDVTITTDQLQRGTKG